MIPAVIRNLVCWIFQSGYVEYYIFVMENYNKQFHLYIVTSASSCLVFVSFSFFFIELVPFYVETR